MKVLKVSLLVKIVGGHSADEALWHFFSETACKWRGKEGGGTKFDSTMHMQLSNISSHIYYFTSQIVDPITSDLTKN